MITGPIHMDKKNYQVDEYYLEIQCKAQKLDEKNEELEKDRPFPGLRPFRASEAHFFFGREGLARDILDLLLNRSNFLAILGASGSGKSSLIRAGLIPDLHAGKLQKRCSNWRIVICRPGNSPIQNLAAALTRTKKLADSTLKESEQELNETIYNTLTASSYGLLEVLEKFNDIYEKTLIVIDQFEELFRFYDKKPATKVANKRFVNLLLTASGLPRSPVYVIITMRSEFLGDCAVFRNLPEAINKGQYMVPRLTPENIEDAIEGPLSVVGQKIERPLVNLLIHEVGDDMYQLPVLQHALMRTYNEAMSRPEGERKLSIDDYKKIGAMAKALSNHATSIYDRLKNGEHGEKGLSRKQEIAKLIFQRLTDLSDGNKGGRNPTSLYTLHAIAKEEPLKATKTEVNEVIDAFRGENTSLLMPPIGTDLKDHLVIDISHESLMRNWDLLKSSKKKDGWMKEEAESGKRYLQLNERREDNHIGSDNLLNDLLYWKETNCIGPVWAKRYYDSKNPETDFKKNIDFLEASEKNRTERELKYFNDAKKKRRKLIITSITGFILLIAGWVLVGIVFNAKANVENQRILSIFETLKRSNPTLSYNVVKWFEATGQKNADKLNDFLKTFKTDNSYLLANVPLLSDSLTSIDYEADGTVSINEGSFISKWNLEKGVLRSRNELPREKQVLISSYLGNDRVLRALNGAGKHYYIVYSSGSPYGFLSIRDANNNELLKYKLNDEYGGWASHNRVAGNVKLSENGKYVFIGNEIFNLNTQQKAAEIHDILQPLDSILRDSLLLKDNYNGLEWQIARNAQGYFFPDNQHFVATYPNGLIKIIRFDPSTDDTKGELVAAFINKDAQDLPINSIVIDNSNRHIIASKEDFTIDVWKFDNQGKDAFSGSIFNREPEYILTGHTGTINCMKISPNNTELLTGSEDNLAMLWNIETGERGSILRGNDFPIKFVDFSNSGAYMFTSDLTKRLSVWKMAEPGNIDFPMKISPFEFYQRGMDEDIKVNAENIYNIDSSTGTEELSGVVFHYLSSLPKKNLFPEDDNYKKGLRKSLNEIDDLFNMLILKSDFQSTVSASFQRLLFDNYFLLQLRKFEMVFERDTIPKNARKSILNRYALNHYLEDTVNGQIAIDYANELLNSNFSGKDSLQIVLNNEAMANLVAGFRPKSVADSNLINDFSKQLSAYHRYNNDYTNSYKILNKIGGYNSQDPSFWYRRSWYALFANDYEDAMESAKRTLELDATKTGVHTNIALSYLLSGQWDKAEQVYLDWKDKVFIDHNRMSNELFLEDLDALEENGITHPDFEKVRELFQ